MFAIGTHVMYAANGVYTVTGICASPVDKKDTRQFYELQAFSGNGSGRSYVPVGSDLVPLREVMTQEEATALMAQFQTLPVLVVENERDRRNVYRTALADYSPIAFARIVRTVAQRRSQLAGTSKRLPETDAEYERIATLNLVGEIACVLSRPFADVEQLVLELLA